MSSLIRNRGFLGFPLLAGGSAKQREWMELLATADKLVGLINILRRRAECLRFTWENLDYFTVLNALPAHAAMEKYELLGLRFNRLQDLLMQVFQNLARLERRHDIAERPLDLLTLMEKRGILSDLELWRALRITVNIDEVEDEEVDEAQQLRQSFKAFHEHTALLLEWVDKASVYAQTLIKETKEGQIN